MVHPSSVLKEISFSAALDETDMMVKSSVKAAAFSKGLFLIGSSLSVKPTKQPRSFIQLFFHPIHNTRYQILIQLKELISNCSTLVYHQLAAPLFCEFIHLSHRLGNRPVTSTSDIENWRFLRAQICLFFICRNIPRQNHCRLDARLFNGGRHRMLSTNHSAQNS